MKKFILLILVLSLNSSVSYATDWENAQWIWQQEDGPANTWVAFRKEFKLSEVPDASLAHIAVDTKYWLWINGELVVFEGGLARGASPTESYYDEVDIARYLKAGENTVAVLVWYWGRTRKTHDDSGKGGLCFHADLGESAIVSDASWKMKVHPAYDPTSGGGGNQPNRVNAYNVKFDARESMGDWSAAAWYNTSYSDKDWDSAVEKGTPPSNPWGQLVKRCIPMWNDRGLANYSSLKVAENIITLPFTNTKDSNIVIHAQLPFNRQITPYLKVKSAAGKIIDIDTDNHFNLLKAVYTTTSGIQEFESYTWFNGNTVEYTIPPDVEVLGLQYRWTGLGEMTGNFECSDPFYERLWWMARNTLYVCARDNYMDCPDRERGLWIGDVADQCGAVFYSLDDAGRQLMKKAIDNTIAYRDGDTIQGLAPGFGAYRGKSSELTAQSLQFVDQGIWRYYYNTGDKATLANAYPAILKYLKMWKMLPNGFPEKRKGYASWVDWGEHSDKEPIEVCWYYIALKATRKMAATLEQNQDFSWYDERIKSIEKHFNGKYWRGAFYGSEGSVKDDRINALAILSGLADESKYTSMLDSILVPVQHASPHMEWMVEEAIMKTGHYDKGLMRMRQRYAPQVDDIALSTLCEKFGERRGTYNHAWNAPNYVLSRYIAGIKATDVAWSSYEVMPNMAHLQHVKQIVPSVKGDITVDIYKQDKQYKIALVSPDKTTATIGIPKSDKAVFSITANGQVIWENGTFKKGVKGITYDGENSNYLKFGVLPGEWEVKATY